jgi:hypothetical protein
MSEQTIKASPIVKSLNEEKRLATFLVLEPQDDDLTTTDLHGDWYNADTVEDACHSFNRFCRKANLFHLVDTTSFEFVESYITEAEITIGEEVIKKGSWLAKIYVNKSESGNLVWESIKSGEFNGLSVQCEGFVSDIE